MSETKEPPYTVIELDRGVEIRDYPPVAVAEVVVSGIREKAISDGFRLLANYIFGNNNQDRAIAMTKPVVQQKSQNTPSEIIEGVNSWVVRFFMLGQEPFPQPNNSRVILDRLRAKRYAVIRFSGFVTNKKLEFKADELLTQVASMGLKTVGEPIYAFYNPPWTLPFLRRNEIMIEVV